MNAGGPGSGLGATGPNPHVPPVSHINRAAPTSSGGPNTSGGGGGSRLAGKAERAVGSLVGSQALKERGFQKEQEAGAFKMQSAEIAEAERLEKEALMRRERAVAHGEYLVAFLWAGCGEGVGVEGWSALIRSLGRRAPGQQASWWYAEREHLV